MKGVAAGDIVFVFGGLDKRVVLVGSEEWVREVAQEVFEKSGDRGNVVVKGSRRAEVN